MSKAPPMDVVSDIESVLHCYMYDGSIVYRKSLVNDLAEVVVKHSRITANAMLDAALNSGDGSYKP